MRTPADYPSRLDAGAFERFLDLLTEARQFVEYLSESNGRAPADVSPLPGMDEMPGIRGKGFSATIQTILTAALSNPDSLARHYGLFAERALHVFRGDAVVPSAGRDRRFKDELWDSSPFFQGLLQLYLVWCESMQAWIDDQALSEADRQRTQFIFDQLVSAFAPSNLPLNPAALKRAEKTDGESFVLGIRQWIDDVLHNNAMPRQIIPGTYELGKNLACTPGAVVFRNAQLELIQYQPQTQRVRLRPILLIPPQINKFYVFDLRPANSMLGYLAQSGFQVFAVSWRNPGPTERAWGMETYIGALLEALEAIEDISGCRTLNLMSACAGGLTAVVLLGYLAEHRRNVVKSHSLFVTALLSDSTSILDQFATVETIVHAKHWSQLKGVMEGRDLAKIFAWMRPDELVWNYWVNNYLLGRKPHALDVLYWDNDPTRLPAQLHSDFLDMYAKEVFEHPRSLNILGTVIDFSKVRVDTYFTGGSEDYLTPWEGVYRAAKLFRGTHEFVLSDSGHVQSILRPPNLARVEYFTNTVLPDTPQEWKVSAVRHEGSWWPHWTQWLARQSGPVRNSKEVLGSTRFPVLMAAPGSYVFARS